MCAQVPAGGRAFACKRFFGGTIRHWLSLDSFDFFDRSFSEPNAFAVFGGSASCEPDVSGVAVADGAVSVAKGLAGRMDRGVGIEFCFDWARAGLTAHIKASAARNAEMMAVRMSCLLRRIYHKRVRAEAYVFCRPHPALELANLLSHTASGRIRIHDSGCSSAAITHLATACDSVRARNALPAYETKQHSANQE